MLRKSKKNSILKIYESWGNLHENRLLSEHF